MTLSFNRHMRHDTSTLAILLFMLFMLFMPVTLLAQKLTGRVIDAATGETVPMAYVIYKGHNRGTQTDINGHFSVDRHEGWTLTFSSMGYKSQTLRIGRRTPSSVTIKLKENAAQMSELVVKGKRKRYSRKNNPAVELMRRVIDARKRTRLENHDFYQYKKYQKISIASNKWKVDASDTTDTTTSRRRRFLDLDEHTEISPYNHKRVLPLFVDEGVSQHVYRKEPRTERDIILGETSGGINQLFLTGDMVNTAVKDIFQDVDIYDDHIRLLRLHFTSPIGSGAIAFYRFFIKDTVEVDSQKCYHLEFTPNNSQDVGFSGELYVLADSTLHVKRCILGLPPHSGVNFVDEMHIDQTFTQLDNGEWAISRDEMWAEASILNINGLAVRTQTFTDYSFEPLPPSTFRGRAPTRRVADAGSRDEAFWTQYRGNELTEKEANMGNFMDQLQKNRKLRIPLFLLRSLAGNYIETGSTGKPSRFDFGPLMSTFSTNFVDGFRMRISGRTMGALHPHWFWQGYAAYGFKSKQPYYGTTVTYSFNRKQNSPFEFPQRSIAFETTYDVMSPSDRFLTNDKDNLFMGLRTEKVRQMYTYNRQRLSFTYETDYGLSVRSSLTAQHNRVAGDLHFYPLDGGREVQAFRTTELSMELRYCSGLTFINTKQRRFAMNRDKPEYYIRHTAGFNNFLGGQHTLNQTEAGIYMRQWLDSWGHIDMSLDIAAQWNKVPFPLLMTPPISLSYFEQERTFNLMHNMEFFMDRKVTAFVAWSANGKFFNRIPLIKKLKWREYVALRAVWGMLTDKNNPTLAENGGDTRLFVLPEGTYAMDKRRPYFELAVGIRNILDLFSVEWVHRFSYTEHPNAKKNGVRFGLHISF